MGSAGEFVSCGWVAAVAQAARNTTPDALRHCPFRRSTETTTAFCAYAANAEAATLLLWAVKGDERLVRAADRKFHDPKIYTVEWSTGVARDARRGTQLAGAFADTVS